MILWEVVAYSLDDERLGAVVADGNGRLVVFEFGAFDALVEDRLGEESGALDGEGGDAEFFFVGHFGGV